MTTTAGSHSVSAAAKTTAFTSIRAGVDIGGTFTDVALECDGRLFSAKVLTDYAGPERAILAGLLRAASLAGIAPGAIQSIIHGTTLATNALIERRGARTAFITSEGFRDVIEMRTESRFEQYDLGIMLPAPLVPRCDRFTVVGRMDAQGNELVPLDFDGLDKVIAGIAEQGFDSVAVGLIHSYRHPGHERAVRDRLLAALPNLSVSLSSEVSPQIREFERFNTVCANAYVKPLMASYLNRLAAALQKEGIGCPLYMIHSGGGLMSLRSAAMFPVRLLESGPAGGAIYAADVAARYGLDHVLSFDMGGTTAKICLIEHQRPKTARTFEVARTYRFKKGSGMPISIPVIEMVEIGAGGGSIAHVDEMRQVRVGPESAGSEPGPACYGRGGEKPTVTDADLVLGKLDPARFAGGTMALDGLAAGRALEQAIATQLGGDAVQSACAVAEMVDENMANAARVHAVENGCELAGYTMIAYGGAAPLHAGRLCEKLGIDRLLVPPGAGVGSAIGFLRAPFGYESLRSAVMRLGEFDVAMVNTLIDEMEREVSAFVAETGHGGATVRELRAYMRYAGQGWEIPVPVAVGYFQGGTDVAALRAAFIAVYVQLFGHEVEGLDVEVVSWALSLRTEVPVPARVTEIAGVACDGEEAPRPLERRPVFDAKRGGFHECAIHHRDSLRVGWRLDGPAIVLENETSTLVPQGFSVTLQRDRCLLIQRHQA
ncbi:hydantoinase/oxoprolinase family protein [Robbsia andropogonis]|uniref:hydantoinase/oxoprolinase family protein n=1 Tax=Robbsia andropogonis TaxID=28092 RepID=UPI0004671B4C|nr:hydantoinase/oxoprolinase family protein [Robbsia andropogonis]MCP1118712.1 hydantoinase/oxoprolinase family protein [Robbsia andropogonis]MCP1128179.1 hydantoinase/oxoprolinase family protein [Robbsia andropogonis]